MADSRVKTRRRPRSDADDDRSRLAVDEDPVTGPDSAKGRVHGFNRNGARWAGRPEIVDVGAVYEDTYLRDGDRWRFASRVEHTTYITGGKFAEMIRDAAAASRAQGTPPFG